MSPDIYTDGAINIAVANGMIRIDFATFSVSERDDAGNPAVETNHRLVMTPQGFIKTLGNMEAMVTKLLDAGIIVDANEEPRGGPARNQETALEAKDRRAEDRRRRNLQVRK